MPLLLLTAPSNTLIVMSIILVAIFTALVIHSLTLRPFCVDKILEDDDDLPLDQDRAFTEQTEEIKLMLTALAIMSAVGCIISLALGGDLAFHSWLSSGSQGCSVMHLNGLQEGGYAKFFCQDGFLDTSNEASSLTKGSGFRGGMRIYRMAPVYASKGSKSPVAWSVSRDHVLAESPCGDEHPGLCGLFVPSEGGPCATSAVCFTEEERQRFTKLRGVVTKALNAGGATNFDGDSLPTVILTNPDNPLGNMKHLTRAIGLWGFTLLGLLIFVVDILINDILRSKGAYDSLLPYQQVKLDEEYRNGSNSVDGAEDGPSVRFKEAK